MNEYEIKGTYNNHGALVDAKISSKRGIKDYSYFVRFGLPSIIKAVFRDFAIKTKKEEGFVGKKNIDKIFLAAHSMEFLNIVNQIVSSEVAKYFDMYEPKKANERKNRK